MQSKVEKITPKKAQEYLAQNFCNRPISPLTVQKYVRLLQKDKFHLTHQGIAFDEQGRLRDGQHRLAAIVQTNATVNMVVARGITEAAALAIDDGRKRTDSQALSMAHGSLVSGFIAAIAKEMFIGGQHFGTTAKPVVVGRLELVDFFGEHAEAIQTVRESFRDNTQGVGQSYILAAIARASYHLPAKKVKRFAEVLVSGFSKEGDEPIITMRNYILKHKEDKRSRLMRDELYAKTEQVLLEWSGNQWNGRLTKAKKELFPLSSDQLLGAVVDADAAE